MQDTAAQLRSMASHINLHGVHRGHQFARPGTLDRQPVLDISALAYCTAEHIDPASPPAVFFTDEGASLDLIESSPHAMTLIGAISAAIDNYEIPDTDGRPDIVEHVSQWVITPPIGCTLRPTTLEVIGCILRAANTATQQTPHPNAA